MMRKLITAPCWMLFVLIALERTPVPVQGDPFIRHGPSHQRVRAGSTVTFRCLLDVVPPATVSIVWSKDDRQLTSDQGQGRGRVTFGDSGQLLMIANTSIADTGLYTCSARDSGGKNDTSTATASGRLVVEDVPEPPVDVELVSCDARVVHLRWRHVNENNSPLVQFVIEYNTSFRPETWQVAKTQLPGDRYYQRITVSPWGNYSFRVLAQNTVGTSLPSQPTRAVCSTPPDVPHINPRGVCTKNLRPHALVITWQPMPSEEQNAPGFHYVVRWRRHDLAPASKFDEQAVDASSQRLVVDGQPIYKPYEIYVLAVNEVGEAVSPPRLVVGYSSEDVPHEVPQNFRLDSSKTIGDRTVDFLWNAVNTGPWRMQGFFRGFKIKFWKTFEGPSTMREHSIIYREPGQCWNEPAGTASVSQQQQTDGKDSAPAPAATGVGRTKREVTSGHVYNLWPFTNITAQLCVLNAKYEGPPSLPVTFMTKEGVAGPVEQLTIISRSSHQIRLSWNRPTAMNGIFVAYRLTYTVIIPADSLDYNVDKSIDLTGDLNVTRVTLKGLRPRQTYRLTVSAVNRIGPGRPEIVEAATLSDGPPAVPNFTTFSIGKRQLNVTWFSPDGATGAIYAVYYRRLGDQTWSQIFDKMNRQWMIVEGLEPGIVYEMKIVASNGVDADSFHTSSPVKTVRIGIKRDVIQPIFTVLPTSKSGTLVVQLVHPTAGDSFRVLYRQTEREEWLSTETAPASERVTLSQLDRRQKYELRVVVTSAEFGELTSNSRLVPLSGASGANGRGQPDAQASVAGPNSASWSYHNNYHGVVDGVRGVILKALFCTDAAYVPLTFISILCSQTTVGRSQMYFL